MCLVTKDPKGKRVLDLKSPLKAKRRDQRGDSLHERVSYFVEDPGLVPGICLGRLPAILALAKAGLSLWDSTLLEVKGPLHRGCIADDVLHTTYLFISCFMPVMNYSYEVVMKAALWLGSGHHNMRNYLKGLQH